MSDLNPVQWNWTQFKAAGRHVASFSAGAVVVAATWGLVSSAQANDINNALTLIFSGLDNLGKGVAALAAVLIPIYTTLRAAHSASPASQVKEVVQNLSAPQITQAANEVADPGSRNKLIEAVAEMPEVKKIVPVDPAIAKAIPSPKVTPT